MQPTTSEIIRNQLKSHYRNMKKEQVFRKCVICKNSFPENLMIFRFGKQEKELYYCTECDSGLL